MKINNVIWKARKYARNKHRNLYNGEPYSVHLESVLKVATSFGFGEHEIIAPSCILHDTLEDTVATTYEVRKKFGDKIARIVYLVTDKGGDIPRKERHRCTYPQIRGNFEATVVKLCDRIANCESGFKNDMYIREYPYFKKILYIKGENESMWKHLDSLLK